MKRREFLSAVGAAAVSAYLPGCVFGKESVSKKKRPNFIFIFADDWGWGDLGSYGHSVIKTPNLDKFAQDGTLFTQFYVSGSVCSPSRAAIMTGQFPAKNSVHGHFAKPDFNKKRGMPNWLDPNIPTVTGLLHNSGYRTGHFGKWHLGRGKGENGITVAPEPKAYGVDDYRIYSGNGLGWTKGDKHEGKDMDWIPKSTELIVDEAIQFVDKNKDKPFYVNVWLKDTHAYLAPTEEQKKPYKKYGGALEIYYGVVTDADRHLGRLFDKLNELQLSDNTVIVFSSDNGPEDIHVRNASHSGVGSAGPFRGRKRSLYEGGIRVPFIVRWPGHTPAGKVDNATVAGGVDWLPTICSLAGVELSKSINLDGEDMSDTWLGKTKERTKPLMWEWRFKIHGDIIHKSPMLAIREGKWKLLLNPDKSRIELYDIPNDPGEMNNLALKYPDVTKRLSEGLLRWKRTLPPGPVDEEAGKNAYPWPESVER